MGKQTYYRALNRNEKIPYNQTNTESEDRLFFNEPVIENIMQYIERIDILINKENENNLKIAKNISLSAYRSKIFFYDNKKDFNFQTVNTINDFIDNDIPYQEFKLKRHVFENVGYNLSQLMTFIIKCENIYNNKEADIFVGKLLKKYGLEKYISKVLSNINIACGSTFIANYDLNWMKSLHDKDFYIKINRLVRDWLKTHNYDSLKTAKLYYEYNSNHKRTWDFKKEIKALVLRRRYGKTIIPHPETTSFWAVFPNARHWFIDDIMNNIISHNSKTDEHFKKYLQHLVKKDISVNKMLEVLSKLNVDKDVIDSLLEDGKFMWEDISLHNIGNYDYLSKEDEENFEDNFLTN